MGGRPRGGTSAIAHDAIKASIDRLEKRFPISRSGYFGIPGRGKKVRIIASADPEATAEDFWRLLMGKHPVVRTANRKGWQVKFPDGSTAVYRRITSTSGSPGVTLTIETQGMGVARYQRIHFTPNGTGT